MPDHSPIINHPSSPLPARSPNKNHGLLTFTKALEAVMDGHKISKKEWNDEETYGVLENGTLVIHRSDIGDHPWIISSGDLIGEDWFLLD